MYNRGGEGGEKYGVKKKNGDEREREIRFKLHCPITFIFANPKHSNTIKKAIENTPLNTVTSPLVSKYKTVHNIK